MKTVYLDHIASTPCHPEVSRAVLPFFSQVFGNPQSDHPEGWKTRTAIDEARNHVAQLINCTPEEIVFTSSGTEANNFALKGIAHSYGSKGRHLVLSAIEHRSVMTPAKFLEKNGYEVTMIPVDEFGVVDPAAVAAALREDTILVSVMHANNEIGTIEPVEEIGQIARERGVLFHVDAGSSGGIIPVDVKKMNADLLTLSAHNFYGPKGVGALFIRKGVKITPLVHGGAQERGRRTGIENVPGIVGMGVAARVAIEEMEARAIRLKSMRDRLEKGLLDRVPHVYLNGHPTQRLPHVLNVSLEGAEGEAMLLTLADQGIYASSASTCTMMSLETSHVLLAIGRSGYLANSTLLMSVGVDNTMEDMDRVLDRLPPVIEKLRAMSAVTVGDG